MKTKRGTAARTSSKPDVPEDDRQNNERECNGEAKEDGDQQRAQLNKPQHLHAHGHSPLTAA